MRPNTLPAVLWSLDDYEVELAADWQCTETANLGFDQFRGRITPRSAHSLPWTVGLGSVIKGRTEDGMVIWEGTVSAPLQVETDEWVMVAGQGYAYEANKIVDRFPLLVTTVEAWVIGNQSPFDFPQTASSQPTLSYTSSASFIVTSSINNQIEIDGTSMQDISVVFWANGCRISRYSFMARQIGNANQQIEVLAARGPSVYGTARTMKKQGENSASGPTGNYFIEGLVPIEDAYDALILRKTYGSAVTETFRFCFPRVWADTTANDITAKAALIGIGDHMGWDTSGVQDLGSAIFAEFDWAGNAMSAMSQAVAPDDLVWQVRESGSAGKRLEMREWGEKEWTVSGSTGARWDLDQLERYNRVTVSYLDKLGQVRTTTVDADPDPLNGRAVKELQVVLGGQLPVDETSPTPQSFGEAMLAALSPQRYRGEVSFALAYGDNGRPAEYEPRAGDTIRISDFSKLDGELTDRIAAISRGNDGMVVSLEPTSIAGGTLSGRGGIMPGTLLAPTSFYYAPAGSPGTTTPKTTIPDDVIEPWAPTPLGPIYHPAP